MPIPENSWNIVANGEQGRRVVLLDDRKCNLLKGSNLNGDPIFGWFATYPG